MKRVLLVDGDVLVYQIACSAEVATDWGEGNFTLHADETEAKESMDNVLAALRSDLKAQEMVVALTCHKTVNFRKALYPAYKENRTKKRKPMLWKSLRDHLFEHYKAKIKDNLEADDILGIMSTAPFAQHRQERIICSIDKDFKSIPGKLYNLTSKEMLVITENEADYAFMSQVLTGDSTDNYQGLPGCGPVKAAKILGDCDQWPVMWGKVLDAYRKAGLSEEVALTQARMARILRHEDYNFRKKEPILWTPYVGFLV